MLIKGIRIRGTEFFKRIPSYYFYRFEKDFQILSKSIKVIQRNFFATCSEIANKHDRKNSTQFNVIQRSSSHKILHYSRSTSTKRAKNTFPQVADIQDGGTRQKELDTIQRSSSHKILYYSGSTSTKKVKNTFPQVADARDDGTCGNTATAAKL